jgi:hydroxymethylpyrimidine/phosphomethylpyrimidine kinase
MLRRSKPAPVALSIAGSDTGGGAGIQADLKTFAALGVHGTTAIACLTAQNPNRVLALHPCPPGFLRRQMEAVFEELPPRAVKIGMLYSTANVRAVADFFHRFGNRSRPPLIVDPVMVSTSGTRLLHRSAEKALREKLLPLANLAMPNLHEAEILSETLIREPEDLRAAARNIHARYGCAVLVKGGHLAHCQQAIDVLFDGRCEWVYSAPFVRHIRTHGTGCTYSAAVCAAVALGHKLPQAVEIGKNFVTAAIANSRRIGQHFVLGME